MTRLLLLCVALVLCVAPACTKLQEPMPELALPLSLGSSAAGGEQTRGEQSGGDEMVTVRTNTATPWWEALGDPSLAALIERGLDQNLSLRSQWTRLESARALADQARGARFPQVRGQASLGWSRSVGAFGASTSQNAQASLPISYELDVFARAARTHQAAQLDAEASAEDLQAMAMSMSAQIAEAWYDIVSTRAKEELLRAQAEMDATYLELVTLRFREGLASAVDVHQQRLQATRSASQIELMTLQRELFEQQLALLLGMRPEELSLPNDSALPELTPPPASGATADMLAMRPDVRAAQRRIEAADRRIAAAVAARLPSIRLSLTPGYAWNRNQFASDSPIGGEARVSSGFTLAAGASLDVPLFDGFAGRSAVRASRAQLDTLIEGLHQAVLQALFEVESSMRQEHRQTRNVELLREQAAIADQTLESAQARYRSGLSDYLPVLTSLQARHALRLQLQDATRQVLSSRIQLHRALGGTWAEEMERPELGAIQETRAVQEPGDGS